MPHPYARRHMPAATRTDHGPNSLVAMVGMLHLHNYGQNQAQFSSDMGTSSDPVPAQKLARHNFGGAASTSTHRNWYTQKLEETCSAWQSLSVLDVVNSNSM